MAEDPLLGPFAVRLTTRVNRHQLQPPADGGTRGHGNGPTANSGGGRPEEPDGAASNLLMIPLA